MDVLLGLQWGDEGKGKVVDVLTPDYELVCRFQGGPNAGHTLEFENKKYVLRSIPSGIFQGDKVNVIGNGVVLDPALFQAEIEQLAASGHQLTSRLKISRKAHLILPTHRLLDAANEAAKGAGKIGTTGKGIGPTYTDKTGRNGLRVGDIECNFAEKYEAHKQRHLSMLSQMGFSVDAAKLAEDEKACGAELEVPAKFGGFKLLKVYYTSMSKESGSWGLCSDYDWNDKWPGREAELTATLAKLTTMNAMLSR